MSVVSPSARLRSPLAAAVVLLAFAVGTPAHAASSRSPFTIAGTSAKRLRMCGAAHQTLSTISGARLVVTMREGPRTTRSRGIGRCRAAAPPPPAHAALGGRGALRRGLVAQLQARRRARAGAPAPAPAGGRLPDQRPRP